MLDRLKSILSAIILLISASVAVYGQYYSLGNDPSRARWMQLSSKNYKIIYPAETDSLARLYLTTLERVRPYVMADLAIDPKPLPVVLHPYTTLSNGLVSWAPKRMELFSSPDPYSSNPDPWIRHLTIHESTHVGQVEHMTKGIYNVFYYLLGEQVTGLGLGLFISQYILEGGAVVSETQLTNSGRGRNADFTKYMRAMYINGDFRNWDRMMMGSFRHYTPNHYVFGYLLGSYARYISGSKDLYRKYFETPVKGWYHLGKLIDPMLYTTGISSQKMLEYSQKTLAEMWRADYLSRGDLTVSDDLKPKRERLYIEYTDPIYIHDPESPCFGSVIATKSGMNTARKLVMVDSSGKERFLRFFNSTSSRLTFDGKSRIYWTEPVSNDAADLEDFSVVMYFDIYSGKTVSLTRRTKYFNPAPSVTGDTLSVAEYPIGRPTRLVLLSSGTGEVLSTIEIPRNGQIRESVFIGEDIYASIIQDEGIGISRWDGENWEETIAPQFQSIMGLKRYGRHLYFSSDLDGVVNIYRLDTVTDSLTHITNSGYGADYPYFDPVEKTLYYCEYGLDGYRLVRTTPEHFSNTPADFSRPYRHPLAELITDQNRQLTDSLISAGALDTTAASVDYTDRTAWPARRYNKFLHSFRIHSWFPAYVDVDRIMSFSFERITQVASAGATILSQNTLGTVTTSLSYGYVKDWNTGKWFHSGHLTLDTRLIGNLAAEVRVDLNERNTMTYSFNLLTGKQTVSENLHSPLLSVSAMLYYPLSFNSRGWYRSLTPFVSWNLANDRYDAPMLGKSVIRHQLQYGISYGQVIPTATSQIYPRWGFGITARGMSSLGTGMYFRDLVYLNGYAYLPGITRQQGLKLAVSAQLQLDQTRLLTSSMASLPRGYNRYSFADTYINLTADYAIPVPLGDFRLGPILYVKRLQLIPFADYGLELDREGDHTGYLSYGADVLVDFNILRLNFPMSAGVRYARTGPNENLSRNYFGFLFNLSLF